MKRAAGGVAYREQGPEDAPVALMLHGYPESGFMWRDVLQAVADAGWRAVAPDLPGFGDSPADPPGTWERQVEAVERLREDLELGAVALVVHDWGGLIGLRWACDHPDAVRALAISSTGFFPDGKWHGMAQALRTEGQGEELLDNMTRDGLAAMLGQISAASTARPPTSTGRRSSIQRVAATSSTSTGRGTSRSCAPTTAGSRRSACRP